MILKIRSGQTHLISVQRSGGVERSSYIGIQMRLL